jgi:hypothetical protein
MIEPPLAHPFLHYPRALALSNLCGERVTGAAKRRILSRGFRPSFCAAQHHTALPHWYLLPNGEIFASNPLAAGRDKT